MQTTRKRLYNPQDSPNDRSTLPKNKYVLGYYYNTHNYVPHVAKRGTPKLVQSDVLTRISLLTVQNRLSSSLQTSQQLFNDGYIGVSKSTVHRYRKKLEY